MLAAQPCQKPCSFSSSREAGENEDESWRSANKCMHGCDPTTPPLTAPGAPPRAEGTERANVLATDARNCRRFTQTTKRGGRGHDTAGTRDTTRPHRPHKSWSPELERGGEVRVQAQGKPHRGDLTDLTSCGQLQLLLLLLFRRRWDYRDLGFSLYTEVPHFYLFIFRTT